MTKLTWDVIHECDLDDGTATEWCARVTAPGGWVRFVWIDWMSDNSYEVAVQYTGDSDSVNSCSTGHIFQTLATCKSLTSAKRWAARYL